jgi:hypothetical protein
VGTRVSARDFLERTGGGAPILLGDIQGPIDNAALIFGHPAFLESLITTPRGLFMHVDITNGLVGQDWPETDLDEICAVLEAGASFRRES